MNNLEQKSIIAKQTETTKDGNSFVEFLTVTIKYRWFLF